MPEGEEPDWRGEKVMKRNFERDMVSYLRSLVVAARVIAVLVLIGTAAKIVFVLKLYGII